MDQGSEPHVLCIGRQTLNYWITRKSIFSCITHAPSKNYMRCWFPEPIFNSHVNTEYCLRQVSNHCEARTLQMDPAVTWIKSPDKSFWNREQWWAGASLYTLSTLTALMSMSILICLLLLRFSLKVQEKLARAGIILVLKTMFLLGYCKVRHT